MILTVAAGTGYTVGSPSSATGTILNDDVPSASISVAPASVTEDGAANLVYTVTLSQASVNPVSVNFTASGTATSGADYAAVTSPLAIPAGNTTGTITIDPTADATPESDETVILTLNAGTGYVVGAPASATGILLNDDVPVTLTPSTLPNGAVAAAYSQNVTATGGTGPYTFAVTSGALPAGLSLSSAGTLIGTPTAGGSFNFTVAATDSFGQTASRAYTVVVAVPTMTLTPGTLPAGTAGAAYSQTLTIGGGIAPYTVTQIGALPAGIGFDAATRTFSGTPTQSGSFNIAVTVTDSTASAAATVTGNYTLTIAAPALTLSPASLPAGTAGIAYSQTFVGGGGVAPYSYTVGAGALPAGMTLDAGTGALSGTPTAAGTFNFSVTATDSTTGTAGTATNA